VTIKIRPKEQCRWDLVSLGEVMRRLDPGDGRIATTREFRAWEDGGEYNVARALKRCFGKTSLQTFLIQSQSSGTHVCSQFVLAIPVLFE